MVDQRQIYTILYGSIASCAHSDVVDQSTYTIKIQIHNYDSSSTEKHQQYFNREKKKNSLVKKYIVTRIHSQLRSNVEKPTFVLWSPWTNLYPPAQIIEAYTLLIGL